MSNMLKHVDGFHDKPSSCPNTLSLLPGFRHCFSAFANRVNLSTRGPARVGASSRRCAELDRV